MNSQCESETAKHVVATGYMSEEAFNRACCSLVERSQNNDIDGVSFQLRDKVRLMMILSLGLQHRFYRTT